MIHGGSKKHSPKYSEVELLKKQAYGRMARKAGAYQTVPDVFYDSQITRQSTRVVYAALVSYDYNCNGYAYPTHEELARKAGMTTTNLKNTCLPELQRLGLITIIYRGKNRGNFYYLFDTIDESRNVDWETGRVKAFFDLNKDTLPFNPTPELRASLRSKSSYPTKGKPAYPSLSKPTYSEEYNEEDNSKKISLLSLEIDGYAGLGDADNSEEIYGTLGSTSGTYGYESLQGTESYGNHYESADCSEDLYGGVEMYMEEEEEYE